MNKIFRVIWNKSTQSWVAVSELARGRVKASSNGENGVVIERSVLTQFNVAAMSIPFVVGLLSIVPTAQAAQSVQSAGAANVFVETKGGKGNSNILIGEMAASGQTVLTPKFGESYAFGSASNGKASPDERGINNVIIGQDAKGAGNNGVVIGNGARTWGLSGSANDQVAIGSNAVSAGISTIALGVNAAAGADRAVSIGPDSFAVRGGSVALGNNSIAEQVDSVAVGNGARASLASAVALGAGALTDAAATKEGNINVAGTAYDSVSGEVINTSMLVSVGKKGAERQIKNVAPGKISVDSTDAINGSQLYSITKGLQTNPLTFSGTSGSTSRKLGETLQITGDGTTSGDYTSKNIKTEATAGKIEIKFADNPTFSDVKANSLTTTAGITAGGNIQANGGLSVAANKAVNMGGNKVQGVSDGVADSDAVNVSQLNAVRNNTLKLTGNSGDTAAQALNKSGGLGFGVKGDGTYLSSTAGGSDVTLDLTQATKNKINNAADKSLSNIDAAGVSVIKNHAKDAIAMENGTNTLVSNRDNNGVKTFKVDVDLTPYAKTAELGNTNLAYKANGGTAKNTALNRGLNFTSADGLTVAAKDNGEVAFGLDADTKAKLNKVETVTAGNGITVSDGTNSSGGKQFTVSVNDNYINETAKNAVKVINGQNTTVTESKEGNAKTYAVNVDLSGVAKTDLSNLTPAGNTAVQNLAKQAVEVKGADLAVVTPSENGGKAVYTVSVSGQAVRNEAKNAISVSGNADITATEGEKNGKKDFALQLNKADNITANDEKAATSKAVHTAVVGAKTKVSSSDNSVTVTKTESSDLNPNLYDLSVNTTKLKQDLGDTFAKTDATNIDPAVWRNKLDTYNKAETDTAIDKAKETVIQGTGITVSEGINATGGKSFTVSVDNEHIKAQAKQAVGVRAEGLASVAQTTENGKDVYTVSVTEQAVRSAAKSAINVSGNGDITVTPSENGGSKTFAVSLEKSAQVAAGDHKAVTSDAVHTAVNAAGWNLKANNETAAKRINNNGEVSFNQGKNIEISRSEGNITVKTVDSPTFVNLETTGTATIGGLLNANGGLSVANGKNIDMGNNKISNVQAGTAPNDAVNFSQLQQAAATSGFNIERQWSVETQPTQISRVNKDHNVNFKEGLMTSVSVVNNGDRTDITYNVVLQDIDVDDKTGLATPNATNIVGTDKGATTASVVSGAINKAVAKSGFLLGVNGETAATAEKVNKDELLIFKQGDNIDISREGKTVTVKTVQNPTFTSVDTTTLNATTGKIDTLTSKAITTETLTTSGNAQIGGTATVTGMLTANGGLTVAAGTSVNVNNNKIQNVADGEVSVASKEAVNGSQLYRAKNELTEQGVSFTSANSGTTTKRKLGETLAIEGKATSGTAYSGGNVKTVVSDGKVEIQIADNPTFADVQATSLNATTVNATTVNASTLTAKTGSIDTLTSKAITTETLTTSGDAAIGGTATVTGMLNANGGLTVAADKTVNMGNNLVEGVKAGEKDTDAVNLSQLNASNAVVNKGWNVTTSKSAGNVDGTILDQINMGETVTFDAGKNVNITQAANKISIAVSENPTFTTLTTTGNAQIGGAATVTGMLNANGGLTVANGQTVDMGGNKITKVAKGEADDDAVNVKQLNDSVNAGGWTLKANNQADGKRINNNGEVSFNQGKNIEISRSEGNITVKTVENPTFTSVDTTTLNATTGKIDTLTSNAITTETLTATTGTINTLTSKSITTEALSAQNANIDTLAVSGAATVTGMLNANGGLTVAAGKTVDVGNNKIQNVADGTSDKDAVNLSQLNATRQALSDKGLKFQGNDGTPNPTHRNLGETLQIVGDAASGTAYSAKNVKTVVSDGKVEIQIADNPTFADIQATSLNATTVNATTVNATNGKIDTLTSKAITTETLTTSGDAAIGGTATVTGMLNANGGLTVAADKTVNMGNNLVEGVKAGEKDTDAVNLSQLNASNAVVNKGWNVTTSKSDGSVSGTLVDQINMGETVTFDAGKNVNITQAANKISIAVSENPTFTTLTTTGNAQIGGTATVTGMLNANGGLTVAGGKDVNMGGNRVQNVANGENDLDAVNVSQLNRTNSRIDNIDLEISNLNQGWNIAGNDKTSVEAIKAGRQVNFVHSRNVNAKVESNDGDATVSFEAQTEDLEVNTGRPGEILHPVNPNALATAFNVADSINKSGWQISAAAAPTGAADGRLEKKLITPGQEITLKSGKNIKVTQKGTEFIYATQDDVAFNTVTADTSVAVAGGPSLNRSGINAANRVISNVSNGVKDSDAVNLSQLNATRQALTDKGLNFTGNDGSTARKLGETLQIVGGTTSGQFSAKNVKTVVSDGKVEIQIADNPTFADIQATSLNATTVNATTVNANTVKANDIQTATLTTTGDATVGGMLNANGGLNVAAGTSVNVNNNRIQNVADGTEDKDAVNLSQLRNSVNAGGWTLKANNQTDGKRINNNGEVSFNQGKNIEISRSEGNITVKTVENPTFTSVDTTTLNATTAKVGTLNATTANIDTAKVGTLTATSGSIDTLTSKTANIETLAVSGAATVGGMLNANGGLTVANGKTVDVGNNKIQNVADGTSDKDAVNLSQLNATRQALTDKGLNFTGNDGSTARKLGETLQIVGGTTSGQFSAKNVKTVVSDGKVEIQIAENPTFADVQATSLNATTVNATTVNASTLTAKTGSIDTLTSKAITTETLTTSGNAAIGGTATVTGMLNANGGLTVAGGKDVNMGGNRVQNIAEATAGTDAVNLDQLNRTVNAGGWTLKANNQTDGKRINNNGEVSFNQGKNIEISRSEGNITVKTVENPTFTSVDTTTLNATTAKVGTLTATSGSIDSLTSNAITTETLTAATGTINTLTSKVGNIETVNAQAVNTATLTTSGDATVGGMLNANGGLTVAENKNISFGNNRLQNVADGTSDKDAVNLSQLNATRQALTDKGLNFTGNDGSTARKLGETLQIVGGTTSGQFSAKNVKTVVSDGKVEIQIAENPEFNAIKANSLNATTVNATTVNATTVNATTVNANTVKANDIQTATLTTTGNAAIGGTATVTGMLTANGGLTVAENKTVNMGGNRVQNIAEATAGTDAVNLDQLNRTVNAGGWTLKANNQTDGKRINNNGEVSFNQGKNIEISRSEGNITVKTVENPTFTSVDTETLNATTAKVGTLTATSGSIDSLTSKAITTETLTATTGTINTLTSKVGNIETVNAQAVNTATLTTSGDANIGGMLNANGGLTVGADKTVNMGGNLVEGVKAGEKDTDAVNLSQLNATRQALTDKGLNFTGNDGSTARKLGETLQIVGGTTSGQFSAKNVKTVVSDGKVEIQIAENPTFADVQANSLNATTVNATTVNANTVKANDIQTATLTTSGDAAIGGTATVTGMLNANGGLTVAADKTVNMGGNRVQNIAEATAGTDAVNLDQLNRTVNAGGWTLKANNQTDGKRINNNGEVSFNQGKNIEISRSEGNITVKTVESPTFTSVDTETLNATTAQVGTLNATTANIDTAKVGTLTATSGSIDSLTSKAITTETLTAATGTINTLTSKVGNIETVNAQAVNTATLTTSGDANIGGMLNANGGLTVGADKTVNMGGNLVEGVKAGEKDTDAVNLSQLNATRQALTDKGLKFQGNDGTPNPTHRNLGETLQIVGGAASGTAYSAKNVKTVVSDGKVEIQIADNPTFADVQANSLNATTVNANDVHTHNLSAKSATVTEKFVSSGNTTLGGAGKSVNIVGGSNVDFGGNVLHNVSAGAADTDATNVKQVKDLLAGSAWTLKNGAVDGGEDATDENLAAEQINPNDQLKLQAGKNIKVKREANGTVTYATTENVSFATVNAAQINANNLAVSGAATLNQLTVNGAARFNNGFSVAPNQVVDMGGNRVQNVADAVDNTDAVNLKQLKALSDALTKAGLNFSGNEGETARQLGQTLTIEGKATSDGTYSSGNVKTVVSDGKVEIQIADNPTFADVKADSLSAKNVNADSVTAKTVQAVGIEAKSANVTENLVSSGNTTLGGAGKAVNIVSGTTVDMGGNRVQNIGDAVADSDAVNLKQLKATNAEVAKGWNVTTSQSGTGVAKNSTTEQINMGETVTVDAGNNIEITQSGNKISIATSMKPTFDSATVGGEGQNFTVKQGTTVNLGGNVIQGVADGNIAPGSQDAVNGGQLYALKQVVGDSRSTNMTIVYPNGTTAVVPVMESNGYTLTTYNVENQKEYRTNNVIEAIGRMNEQGIKFFHTNDGTVRPEVQGENNIDSSASGKYASAVGYQAKASGENAIAMGKGAQATGDNAISVGTGNIVSGNNSGAFGDPSTVSGNESYVVGNNNQVSSNNTFVVGNNVTKTADNSVFLGADSGYVAESATTKGNAAHISQEIGGQSYQYAGGEASEVVGVVSVGNVNADGTMQTRRVQNVAPGLVTAESTDAINGSQLYALTGFVNQGWELNTGSVEGSNGVVKNSAPAKVGLGNAFQVNAGQNIVVTQNGKSIDIATSMTPTFNSLKINQGGTVDMGGNRIQNVGNAIKPTDALNYGQFKAELGRVDARLRSGIAGAVASASLVQAFNPSESLLAVGGGTYRGASAVSLGYSKVSDNGKIIFKVIGSANNYGDVMGGASVGFKF